MLNDVIKEWFLDAHGQWSVEGGGGDTAHLATVPSQLRSRSLQPCLSAFCLLHWEWGQREIRLSGDTGEQHLHLFKKWFSIISHHHVLLDRCFLYQWKLLNAGNVKFEILFQFQPYKKLCKYFFLPWWVNCWKSTEIIHRFMEILGEGRVKLLDQQQQLICWYDCDLSKVVLCQSDSSLVSDGDPAHALSDIMNISPGTGSLELNFRLKSLDLHEPGAGNKKL